MPSPIVFPDADDNFDRLLASSGVGDRLRQLGDFTLYLGAPADDAEFSARIDGAEVLFLGGYIPDSVLRGASALRMISWLGTGASDYVNLPLARELGIRVANTPGYGNASVSEHAIALLLAVARNVVSGDSAARRGEWEVTPGFVLANSTVGVIGYGGIGKRTADLLSAFGAKVLIWTRTPRASDSLLDGQSFVDLPTLLRESEAVTLHLVLNAETQNLIGDEQIALLRDGAIVINTARAGIIAPGLFEKRLADGTLRAGLDVFRQEPLDPGDPLASLGSVVLSPHQGYNTPHALETLLSIAADNVESYFEGRDFPLA